MFQGYIFQEKRIWKIPFAKCRQLCLDLDTFNIRAIVIASTFPGIPIRR